MPRVHYPVHDWDRTPVFHLCASSGSSEGRHRVRHYSPAVCLKSDRLASNHWWYFHLVSHMIILETHCLHFWLAPRVSVLISVTQEASDSVQMLSQALLNEATILNTQRSTPSGWFLAKSSYCKPPSLVNVSDCSSFLINEVFLKMGHIVSGSLF